MLLSRFNEAWRLFDFDFLKFTFIYKIFKDVHAFLISEIVRP